MKLKVFLVFGTRPEAIKMAPIVRELETDSNFDVKVVVTGQHREMLDQVLTRFSINPHYDLDIMQPGQTLSDITNSTLQKLSPILEKEKPDILLVHGDTTTTFSAALCAFYQQIPIGHVEAGLRTWKRYSPFPEEMNRNLTDCLSNLYFAPTDQSRQNLLLENYSSDYIYVTGNTAIDAMKYTVDPDYSIPKEIKNGKKRLVLITMHRRENLGEPMKQVFEAVKAAALSYTDAQFIFPMHKNPKVQTIARSILHGIENISLIENLDVMDFHNYAKQSYLILTDSGGIQEEAPSLGVPVLVLRDQTERPEGLETGALRLVGTKFKDVYQGIDDILSDKKVHDDMIKYPNPYGDGQASRRIKEGIMDYFQTNYKD